MNPDIDRIIKLVWKSSQSTDRGNFLTISPDVDRIVKLVWKNFHSTDRGKFFNNKSRHNRRKFKNKNSVWKISYR